MVRTLPCHGRGRGFESHRFRHFYIMQHTPRLIVFGFKGKFAGYFLNNVFGNRDFFGIEKSYTPLTTQEKTTIQNASILLFCTPYLATQQLLNTVIPIVQPHHTLIDICSVKSNLYPLDKLPNCNIVSLHPLYSPNTPTKHKHCIQCNIQGTAPVPEIVEYFTIKHMTVEEHDNTMAVVQAGIHFQNYVTAHFLAKHRPTAETNLYKALDTVIQQQLSQDTQMMMEIQLYNPYVKSIIASLADSFAELQYAIQNNCPEGVKDFIEQAKSIKV